MRRFYWVLPLLLLSMAASAATRWTVFRDPAGAFTIAVPAKPTVKHSAVAGSDGKPTHVVQYLISRGSEAFVVIVGDFTRFPTTDRVLAAAVAGVRGNAVRDLSDKTISVDGRPGHDIAFVDKDGQRIEDRIFFVGKKLYQVMAVAPQAAPTAEARRFESSFHFTKQ